MMFNMLYLWLSKGLVKTLLFLLVFFVGVEMYEKEVYLYYICIMVVII